jgi:Polymorphic toxin system, DSP-PTPase phosphatase
MNAHSFKGMNGILPIQTGFKAAYQSFSVMGGPYDKFPGRNHAFGVCVRAERAPTGRYNVHLPIHDFSVPSPNQQDEVELALRETLEALLDGKPVYVGCMGGWGRTGLFLALLAKVCGVEHPVTYVRDNYSPRAVETTDQHSYVMEFEVSGLQRWLFWQAWKKKLLGLLPSF